MIAFSSPSRSQICLREGFLKAYASRGLSFNMKRRRFHYTRPLESNDAEKLKILFMGRDEFSCLVLKELYDASDVWGEIVVVTNPDQRIGRRGSQLSVSPLKQLAETLPNLKLEYIPQSKAEFRKWEPPLPYSAHVWQPPSSVEGGVATQADTNPPPSHILVTASFGRILSRTHLSHFMPSRRLNVHPSLLPQYRGPAPIQHALLNGETKTGVCIIEMLQAMKRKVQDANSPDKKSGIDAGDIWACKEVEQPQDADFHHMRNLLGSEGGKLLVEVLQKMKHGTQDVALPQNVDPNVPLRPAPMIQLEDAWFDPCTMSAEDIARRWRAIGHQRPIHTCLQSQHSSESNEAIQLHDLHVYTGSSSAADQILPLLPGSVAYDGKDSATGKALLVRCKDAGILCVSKVKPEGKPVLSASDFWNGVKGKGKGVRCVGQASASL